MVEEAASSSTASLKDDKPVIVRVKRKSYQSPLEAFWLEINERPVKRPLLDFQKLSISDSASKVEELKTKKLFVQHVDTVSSSDVAADVLQSYVFSEPNSTNSKVKVEDQRRSNKTDNKQKQLLVKAKETQELLAKNARFKQIWKKRKGTDTLASDDALHDMCRLYDVERVDVGGTSVVHEQEDEEDQRLMNSFLPLIQEFIPSAAKEIEYDINRRMIKQATKDDFVYDLYAVKDDNISMMEGHTSSPIPFVQVDDDDDFYEGPDNSDYETDDSNAEDNPLNDYPDEEDDEDDDEDGSKTSEENSEENKSESSGSETTRDLDLSDDDILMDKEDDDDDDDDNAYDDDDDESYVWQ